MDSMENGSYKVIKEERRRHLKMIPERFEYVAKFEWVKDSSRLKLRKGDIIKFDNSSRFPSYAKNQYGLILRRYKWTKYKFFGTFVDYGAQVKMLTGKREGHIRRFYQLRSRLKVTNFESESLWFSALKTGCASVTKGLYRK